MKQRIISFWESGLTGKVAIGCGTIYIVVGMAAICVITGALLWPMKSSQQLEQPLQPAQETIVGENLSAPMQIVETPKIVFVASGIGENPDIYTIGIDGVGAKNLTNHQAWDNSPDWSPDGKHIVFMSKRDGNDEIYVMDANGNEQVNLSRNPSYDSNPT